VINDVHNEWKSLKKYVQISYQKEEKGPILLRGKSVFSTFLKLILENFGGIYMFEKQKKIA